MATAIQQQDGIISFDIFTDGKKINDTVEIIEISVEMEINRIASATIIMEDGGSIGVDNADFVNSEGDDFVPGKKIKISMGYEDTRDDVFEGIIVSQNLKVKNNISQLIVTCRDEAIKMTKSRNYSIFPNMTDSDAISKIAEKYGLSPSVESTSYNYAQLMQYNSTDWDFVVIRAEMNNLFVITDKNKLTVKSYKFDSPKNTIDASQSIISIDICLDSQNVTNSINLSAWDPATQSGITEKVTITNDTSQGNITAKKLSDAVNSEGLSHYSSASMESAELKNWGDSMATKGVLSKIQGKISIPGFAGLIAGDIVTLSGFSDRFNGDAFVSRVEQKMENGTWVTTLNVGRPLQWHSALPDVEETFASGLLPPANGTQIAIVQKIHEDPNGIHRVLVTLPVFSGDNQANGLWARLAFPYASNQAGFFFFPEIGDEVLVSFINNDPRVPVITGSLYSSKNVPMYVPEEKNKYKSIYTKSGINISFDDEDKILTIITPEKNSFMLNDKDKSITVQDQHENKMVLNESGIELNSPKEIKISAKEDINISSQGGINLTAAKDIKADGTNVQLSAKTSFTAKGNGSAEVSASGQTTIKGGVVMIN